MSGRYAGVLAFHGDRVALVRESYPAWGGSFWNVPSGAVEDGESPAEGAARELREETGLVIDPASLELVSTIDAVSADRHSLAWNYTARVADDELCIDDPDGLIEQVRWFPRPAAITVLEQLPYEPLRVPAAAYLRERWTSPRTWSFVV